MTFARWTIAIAAATALTACAVAGGSGPSCGDGACTADESCATCATDCGACVDSGAGAGDDLCGGGTCDAATGPLCGDHTCDTTESCGSCPADCGSCPPQPTCGDDVCDVVGGECASCSADCNGICGACGDATCDPNEDEVSCPADCAASMGTCSHSWCDIGGPLALDCDPCVTEVCNLDLYCCLVEWDVSCKNAVSSMCLQDC